MEKTNHISENRKAQPHQLPSHIAPPPHKLRTPHRTNFIIALIAAALIIYVVLLFSGSVISPPLTTTLIPGATASPIKHVIIIFQENHAFDNYFGTFPGAVGIPPNTCIPYKIYDLGLGCVKPWLDTNSAEFDAAHSWTASHLAYNNGLMNGFVEAGSDKPFPMAYYDNSTLPYYWYFAKHYTLLDHLFSSTLSYTLPNHWYLISGTAPGDSYKYGQGNLIGPNEGVDSFISNGAITSLGYQYLNQSDQIRTLADELQAGNVSWKYYSAGGCCIKSGIVTTYSAALSNFQVFNYWNPLFAKNITYTPQYFQHIAYTSQIIADINNGNLPAVSWVTPPLELSEHPPYNITYGMYYVTYIVDNVMHSRYWNNTMIVVMWDDYGGYYDSVPPPQMDGYGLSFRVPGIVISPYAKQGYIDNTTYSFESTMKFMEWNFGLPPLTQRDSNANNLLGALNFNQSPQPPYTIPLTQAQFAIVNRYLFNQSASLSALNATNSTILVDGSAFNTSDFDT